MKAMILLCSILACASFVLSNGSPFVGTYRSENVMLQIKEPDAGRFIGTISVGGELINFTAREQSGMLTGSLTVDDETMPMRISLKGAVLTVTIGEESQILTKAGASIPEKPVAAAVSSNQLRINGIVINAERIRKFEQDAGLRIPPGDFWYDKISGAWGISGGPTAGFTTPQMDLGGPLKEDASRGNTGVFINGRHLPMQDVIGLQSLGVPVQQGRWWVDHTGNFGIEGSPQMLGNLFQYSRGRGGSYQRATAGGYIGGDGQTSYFFDPKSGSSVMVGQ